MSNSSRREPICLAEERRLTSLYALGQLDSPADWQLQALVDDAAALFDAPMAVIALVDRNHQYFRARHGLDLIETNRSCSFSTHAIQDAGVYEIVDMDRHDIYAANPLVLGDPHIRYYCAAPLQLANGRRIGTIAVVDDRVREAASDAQKSDLTKLADQVVARMQILARRTQLHATKAQRGGGNAEDNRFASLCGSLIAA